MNEVIKWLESPEGEEWSRRNHRSGYFVPAVLLTIKDDADTSQDSYLWWR